MSYFWLKMNNPMFFFYLLPEISKGYLDSSFDFEIDSFQLPSPGFLDEQADITSASSASSCDRDVSSFHSHKTKSMGKSLNQQTLHTASNMNSRLLESRTHLNSLFQLDGSPSFSPRCLDDQLLSDSMESCSDCVDEDHLNPTNHSTLTVLQGPKCLNESTDFYNETSSTECDDSMFLFSRDLVRSPHTIPQYYVNPKSLTNTLLKTDVFEVQSFSSSSTLSKKSSTVEGDTITTETERYPLENAPVDSCKSKNCSRHQNVLFSNHASRTKENSLGVSEGIKLCNPQVLGPTHPTPPTAYLKQDLRRRLQNSDRSYTLLPEITESLTKKKDSSFMYSTEPSGMCNNNLKNISSIVQTSYSNPNSRSLRSIRTVPNVNEISEIKSGDAVMYNSLDGSAKDVTHLCKKRREDISQCLFGVKGALSEVSDTSIKLTASEGLDQSFPLETSLHIHQMNTPCFALVSDKSAPVSSDPELPIVNVKIPPLLSHSGFYPMNLTRIEPAIQPPGPLPAGNSLKRKVLFRKRASYISFAQRLLPTPTAVIDAKEDSSAKVLKNQVEEEMEENNVKLCKATPLREPRTCEKCVSKQDKTLFGTPVISQVDPDIIIKNCLCSEKDLCEKSYDVQQHSYDRPPAELSGTDVEKMSLLCEATETITLECREEQKDVCVQQISQLMNGVSVSPPPNNLNSSGWNSTESVVCLPRRRKKHRLIKLNKHQMRNPLGFWRNNVKRKQTDLRKRSLNSKHSLVPEVQNEPFVHEESFKSQTSEKDHYVTAEPLEDHVGQAGRGSVNSPEILATPRPIPRATGEKNSLISSLQIQPPIELHQGVCELFSHHEANASVLFPPQVGLEAESQNSKNIPSPVRSASPMLNSPNKVKKKKAHIPRGTKKKGNTCALRAKPTQSCMKPTYKPRNVPLKFFPLNKLPEKYLNHSCVGLQPPLQHNETMVVSYDNGLSLPSVTRPKRVYQKPLRWWLLERVEYSRPSGSECPVPVGVHRRTEGDFFMSSRKQQSHKFQSPMLIDVNQSTLKRTKNSSTRPLARSSTKSLTKSHRILKKHLNDLHSLNVSDSLVPMRKSRSHSLENLMSSSRRPEEIEDSSQRRLPIESESQAQDVPAQTQQAHDVQILEYDQLDFVDIQSDQGSFQVAIVFETSLYSVCEIMLSPGHSKGIDITVSTLLGHVVMVEDHMDSASGSGGFEHGSCLLQIGTKACSMSLQSACRFAKMGLVQKKNLKRKKRTSETLESQRQESTSDLILKPLSEDKHEKHSLSHVCLLLSRGHHFHIPSGTQYNFTNLSSTHPLVLSLTVCRISQSFF